MQMVSWYAARKKCTSTDSIDSTEITAGRNGISHSVVSVVAYCR